MENLLTKTQTLQGLLSAGIHPLEAIATSGLFNDATDIYHKSEEYLTKYLPANDREVDKTQNIRDDNKTQENDREVNKTQEGETV